MYQVTLAAVIALASAKALLRLYPGRRFQFAPFMFGFIQHMMARSYYAPTDRTVAELYLAGSLYGLAWTALVFGLYLLWLKRRPT